VAPEAGLAAGVRAGEPERRLRPAGRGRSRRLGRARRTGRPLRELGRDAQRRFLFDYNLVPRARAGGPRDQPRRRLPATRAAARLPGRQRGGVLRQAVASAPQLTVTLSRPPRGAEIVRVYRTPSPDSVQARTAAARHDCPHTVANRARQLQTRGMTKQGPHGSSNPCPPRRRSRSVRVLLHRASRIGSAGRSSTGRSTIRTIGMRVKQSREVPSSSPAQLPLSDKPGHAVPGPHGPESRQSRRAGPRVWGTAYAKPVSATALRLRIGPAAAGARNERDVANPLVRSAPA
jgi:hypothetical protein